MFNNYLFIIVIIILIAIIGYLVYAVIQKNKNTTTTTKKVTFIGVPNEAQLNKPRWRPRKIKKKFKQDTFLFGPFNNREPYENYSITE